jgi:pimeloyl-ACP methyl ester carboxylesterase
VPEAGGLWYAESGGRPAPGRPPLVLLHGAGSSHLAWPAEFRRLEGELVLALDLPGHGRSAGEGEATIGGYAELVLDWMRAIGQPRALLVGHSMGAAIALASALRAPRRAVGLALLGAGPRLRVNPKLLDWTADPTTFNQAIDFILKWGFGADAQAQAIDVTRSYMSATRPEVLHRDFLACDRFDVEARLAEIACPTLVLCGGEDYLTPPALGESLAARIPGARLERFPDAGHMLMLENPAEAAAMVGRFASEVLGPVVWSG